MASKIVKSTKLLDDGLAIQLVSCRIPFDAALPVVVVSVATLAALAHDTSSIHARTGPKFIRAHMSPFHPEHLPFYVHAHPPRTFHWDA